MAEFYIYIVSCYKFISSFVYVHFYVLKSQCMCTEMYYVISFYVMLHESLCALTLLCVLKPI